LPAQPWIRTWTIGFEPALRHLAEQGRVRRDAVAAYHDAPLVQRRHLRTWISLAQSAARAVSPGAATKAEGAPARRLPRRRSGCETSPRTGRTGASRRPRAPDRRPGRSGSTGLRSCGCTCSWGSSAPWPASACRAPLRARCCTQKGRYQLCQPAARGRGASCCRIPPTVELGVAAVAHKVALLE